MQMLADKCSVNRAIEKIMDSDDSGDDHLIQLGSQPSSSQMPGDMDIPMGASQSNPLSQALPAPGSQQGKRPSQKRPPKSVPVPSLLPHPESLNVEAMSQSQQLSHEQPSRQGSGSLGGSLGRAGSLGAAGPSRLGATGQGRASGYSQQVGLAIPKLAFCSHAEAHANCCLPIWACILALLAADCISLQHLCAYIYHCCHDK